MSSPKSKILAPTVSPESLNFNPLPTSLQVVACSALAHRIAPFVFVVKGSPDFVPLLTFLCSPFAG